MEQWLFWSWKSWWQITRRSRWPWEIQRDYALVSMTVHSTCFARTNFIYWGYYRKNEIRVLLLRYYKILNLQSWETSPNQLRPWEIGRCYALISAVHSAQPPTCNIHTTTNPHNHHSAKPPTWNIHSFPKLFWEKGQSHLLYDSRAESNNHKHYIYLSDKMCIFWFACWNSSVMLLINILHTYVSVKIVVMMIKTLIASTASSFHGLRFYIVCNCTQEQAHIFLLLNIIIIIRPKPARPSGIVGPRYGSSRYILGCSKRLDSRLWRSARIKTNLEL